MSTPLSIRFDPGVIERLRRRVKALPGSTPSGLAERLVDEGLRMAEHPGIVFKDGASGRRASLMLGPDVWEVVKVASELDVRGETAIKAARELLNLSEQSVRTAIRYYASFPEEIDGEIALANDASHAAELAWTRQEKLLR